MGSIPDMPFTRLLPLPEARQVGCRKNQRIFSSVGVSPPRVYGQVSCGLLVWENVAVRVGNLLLAFGLG